MSFLVIVIICVMFLDVRPWNEENCEDNRFLSVSSSKNLIFKTKSVHVFIILY